MNHGFQLLQTLYSSAFGKYTKFKHRFDKAVQSGKFKKLHKRKQASLISRLKRLYEQLKSLQTQLRLAGAGAAFSLAVSLSNPVSAQSALGPFIKNDAANPLPPPFAIIHPKIAVVDIDGDGDLDTFAGNDNGDIQFFRNDSPTGTIRRFTEVTGLENPLDGVNKGNRAAPAFADVDGDGDFDMLLGTRSGNTFFFRNTGSATNPVFTEQTGANNPFDEITGTTGKYGAGEAVPVFVDLDDDGDLDLFIGSSTQRSYYGGYNSSVQYFENQGTVSAPEFVSAFHPLTSTLKYSYNTSLTFADIDNDGDLDVFEGGRYSNLNLFRNDEGSGFPQVGYAWDASNRTGNPAYSLYFQNGSPVFADLDGDEDLDLIVGQSSSYHASIQYYENVDGNYTLQLNDIPKLSPFDGVDVGEDAAPVFVDIDNDGDLDAVIGAKYSGTGLSVYINDGGIFTPDPEHPLTSLISWANVVPVFVDIDADGDLDLFYGGWDVSFFENTGTAANPEFTEQETLFPSVNYSNADDLSLAFIDLDNDGDLDALLGNDKHTQAGILYFENTGTATNPVFTEADTPIPFDDGSLFDSNPNPVATDLDHDGDLDLIITDTYYKGWYNEDDASRTRFFENNGDGTFTEATSPILLSLTPTSFTSLADIDGDGDLDAFVGNGQSFDFNQDGRVFYYENTNPAPVTSVTQNSVSVSINTPVILDPALSINDSDEDDIVLATVVISDFSAGNEELDFTPSAGVTGEFEDGVLTIAGKATIDEYEIILRSVTYEATGDVTSARQSARVADVNAKTVTFNVRDTDFTETIVSVVSVITLDITGELKGITVYNAISPGVTQGKNDYMRIDGLPGDNKVTIFNRWGDQVFKTSGYNNTTHKFEGKNDNGKDLPSGTYYYTIEASGKTITGYLSLKR